MWSVGGVESGVSAVRLTPTESGASTDPVATGSPFAQGSPLASDAFGIGWRPEISGVVAALDGLGFCEVITETLRWTRSRRSASITVPPELAELRDRGVPVIPHGVALSLGGAEPVDPDRVARTAAAARELHAPLVSEHIAFVRAGGVEAGHLLPVPRTRAALDALAVNIFRTTAELEVPLALENIATLFDWPGDEYTEAEFLAELVDRTGVLLLIDIANLYANARNRGRDPLVELSRLPIERIAYCHIAGGHVAGGRYHDTHTDPVPREVLSLVAEFTAAHQVPLLLERDGNYPPAAELLTELDAISAAAARPPITGTAWERFGAGEKRLAEQISTATTKSEAIFGVSDNRVSIRTARAQAPVTREGANFIDTSANSAVAMNPGAEDSAGIAGCPGSAEKLSAADSYVAVGDRRSMGTADQAASESPDLATEQEALVRTLVAGGAPRPGFDADAVSATANALLRKRAGEVAHRYPVLVAGWGPDFADRFIAWAVDRPKMSTAADATAFAADHGLPAPPSPGRTRWDLFRGAGRRLSESIRRATDPHTPWSNTGRT